MPPHPKRSSERRRRNKDSKPQKVTAQGKVDVPEPDEDWHPIARDWYLSLPDSGQSQFFEPSDWQAARFTAQSISAYLQSSRPSGQLFSSVWSAMTDLLSTESSRRRVRLEVEREASEGEPAGVTALDDYRSRLAS